MRAAGAGFAAADLAAALAAARRAGVAVAAAALSKPPTRADAYAAQARFAAAALGAPPSGWKVAVDPAGAPLIAPLLSIARTAAAGDEAGLPASPLSTGFEVEFSLVLGRDLPPRAAPYARAEVLGAIAAVHLGVEVIGARIAERGAAGPLLFLADCLVNDGFWLGPRIDGPEPFASRALEVAVNGVSVFSGAASHPAGDPLAPLLAVLNGGAEAPYRLAAGQVVTTGSLCGVLPLSPGDGVRIVLAGLPPIAARATLGSP